MQNDPSDLDALMASGKEKMYADDLPRERIGYHAPGVSNLERVVVLTGDLLYQFSQNGVGGWVGNYVERNRDIDLPRRVAAVVERHNDADPEMAAFVVDTMAALGRVKLSSGADGADDDTDPAWADVGWRWEVWCGMEGRIERLLKAVCRRWDAALDPFAADLPDWPRAPLVFGPPPVKKRKKPHYPGIAVGFTRDGQGCPHLDQNFASGRCPDVLSMSGIVSWALWRAGVPAKEIARFQTALDKDRARMAETVGAWVNVDGQGDAGVAALHAVLTPPHPWQALLGLDRERAQRINYLFCATAEQATGLIQALGVPVWRTVYAPGAAEAPRADLKASIGICFGASGATDGHVAACGTEEGLVRAIQACLRSGLQEMVVELRGEVVGEDAIRCLARLSLCGVCTAFVGASAALQERLRAKHAEHEHSQEDGWEAMTFNAVGRGPNFSGETVH